MKRLEIAPTPESIADSIANDAAGRNNELLDLIRLIDSIEGPYSLLIDAPWGDGKTFFVRSLEEVLKFLNPQMMAKEEADQRLIIFAAELEAVETPYLPFYFNAWEHDFAEGPISALFASMALRRSRLKLQRRLCLASLKKCSTRIRNGGTDEWFGRDLRKHR